MSSIERIEMVFGILSLTSIALSVYLWRRAAKVPSFPDQPSLTLSWRSRLHARAGFAAALREPPAGDFAFIFATGEREMDDKGIPETSTWAGKYNCGPRRKAEEIVDTNAGYVYDSTRQHPPNPSWGLLPAPGKAEVYIYPDCSDGLLVADVVRLGKGHTEGLEPKVTEELVKLMVSAKSGKMHSF